MGAGAREPPVATAAPAIARRLPGPSRAPLHAAEDRKGRRDVLLRRATLNVGHVERHGAWRTMRRTPHRRRRPAAAGTLATTGRGGICGGLGITARDSARNLLPIVVIDAIVGAVAAVGVRFEAVHGARREHGGGEQEAGWVPDGGELGAGKSTQMALPPW